MVLVAWFPSGAVLLNCHESAPSQVGTHKTTNSYGVMVQPTVCANADMIALSYLLLDVRLTGEILTLYHCPTYC